MGKALAIAAVVFITLGTGYQAIRNTSEVETRRKVSNSQYETITRGAALAGIQVLRQALADAWASTETSGMHQGAKYGTRATISGNEATVVSIGAIQNSGHGHSQYRIRMELARRPSVPGPPLWGKYAIASGQDLQLEGEMTITSLSGTTNANIHTNSTLKTQGSKFSVDGFATYSDGVVAEPKWALDSNITPADNEGGAPVHSQRDPIDMPSFDPDALAEGTRHDGSPMVNQFDVGDIELGGHLDFGGTRLNPYVYHIGGNLTFTKDTVIDGYVVFLVSGQINVDRDVTVGNSGYGGSESSIGMYSGGDLIVSGNRTLEAAAYVGGQYQVYEGSVTMRGSVVTNGGINIAGSALFEYTETSGSLTTFWDAGKLVPFVTAYYER